MKKKKAASLEEAIANLRDSAIVLIGGFGYGGVPESLIEGVCDSGLRNLTIVNNNAGTGHTGIARLLEYALPAGVPLAVGMPAPGSADF